MMVPRSRPVFEVLSRVVHELVAMGACQRAGGSSWRATALWAARRSKDIQAFVFDPGVRESLPSWLFRADRATGSRCWLRAPTTSRNPEQFTQPTHRTQSVQPTQPIQATHRVQARHARQARQPRAATHSTISTLPATPALPAVATEPATATLPAVATEPATATLPAVATEPATATLPAPATEPATPTLSVTATEPATLRLPLVASEPITPVPSGRASKGMGTACHRPRCESKSCTQTRAGSEVIEERSARP